MLTIYHVPGTRSMRIIFACAELDLPLTIQTVDFAPAARAKPEWRALSPTGKVPAMTDGNLSMFESGAMVEYILEKYGNGRLRPAPGTPASAHYLQWSWFAEATLARPLGDVAQHTVVRAEKDRIPAVVEDAKIRVRTCLEAIEGRLDAPFLIGNELTGADIMMSYSLFLAKRFGLLDADLGKTCAYYERLLQFDGMQKALKA